MALIKEEKNIRLMRMMDEIKANTNLNRLNSPGSKIRYLLELFNEYIDNTVTTLDTNMNQLLLSSASGRVLDILGEAYAGLTRRNINVPSISSGERTFLIYTNEANFGTINRGNKIVIPAGTSLHDGNPDLTKRVSYFLNGNVELQPNDSAVYVSATAAGASAKYNIAPFAIKEIAFTAYTDAANKTLLAKNEVAVSQASGTENDEQFRYRIMNAFFERKTSTQTAVRTAALQVSGVADIVFVNHARGIGTADVIVMSTSPETSNRLLQDVQTRIDQVAAAGFLVQAKAPVYYGFSIELTLFHKGSISSSVATEIRSNVTNAIVYYINNLGLGETFTYNYLVSLIYQADSRIVDMGSVGKPIDMIYVFKPSKVSTTNKIRSKVDSSYVLPTAEAKLVIESSITSPIAIRLLNSNMESKKQ